MVAFVLLAFQAVYGMVNAPALALMVLARAVSLVLDFLLGLALRPIIGLILDLVLEAVLMMMQGLIFARIPKLVLILQMGASLV